jgi:hypothetical protein
MYIKKLFIPGEFDDAYVYMQKLLLFDADGGLFSVDLDRVVHQIEEQYDNNVKSIPTHLFSRNDWLAGERFQSLCSNVFIRKAFLDAIGRFPDQIEIEKKWIKHVGDIGVTDVLDVTIYNKRVYMGTDRGTYHIDLGWEKNEIEIDKQPEKRHDALCTQVNAKHGSISISCGDDGLFTRFDEFGFLGDQSGVFQDWRESSDKSYRTSWLFDNLVNYTSPTEPVLLHVIRSNKTIYQDREARTYDKVAIGFEGEPENVRYLLGGITEKQTPDTNSLLFLFNSYSRFYAQTRERTLFEIPAKNDRKSSHLVASRPKLISSNLSGRILDVAFFKQKNINIIELYDSIKLLFDNRLYELAEGEALSIKSYPHSKRFQNLVTVVIEDGVYVICIFDETESI